MESLIYVGIGGFFGANARYLFSLWVNDYLAPRWGPFPYGTLLVNVIGSFGLALFGVWFSARTGMSPQLRLLVGLRRQFQPATRCRRSTRSFC